MVDILKKSTPQITRTLRTHPQEGVHWSVGHVNETSRGTPVVASMAQVVFASPAPAPQSTDTV